MNQEWLFLNQNHLLTPWQKCQFFDFMNFFFFSVERRFFVLEYRETHFPFLNCQKKNVAKMTIFGPKPWVSPLGKMAISRVFELFSFYSVKRRFFVLEYCERHFPFLNCLKKKVGIMASLGPKPWVNPLEKMSIFLLFELLFL